MKLLTRENFKKECFKRDKNKCVFCDKKAIDAHHIIDRKLFKDGGYYINNAASVCSEHHMLCEETKITLEEVYSACRIENPIFPDFFDENKIYDKWGNIIVGEYKRIPGLLFEDDAVQKIFKRQGNIWIFFNND